MAAWSPRAIQWGFRLTAIVAALLFTSLVIVLTGHSPLDAYSAILKGSLGSWRKILQTLSTWTPLLLTSTGLLVTFAAGLWNIGMEGQISMGAVGATWALRVAVDAQWNPAWGLLFAFVVAALFGVLWALLAGMLKIYGGVHEIFAGLGLNFVADAVILYLVFGPWQRPGVASMSGTEPFPLAFHLETLGRSRFSPWALGLALLLWLLVFVLLRKTILGLRLRAVGSNPKAARWLGVSPERLILFAFAVCGLMAGIAGAVQVTGVYYNLRPGISSGYGWLGLLVCMLVLYHPLWVAPVAFFFSMLIVGSVSLPIRLQMDSNLAGVLQGVLVLMVLAGEGVHRLWLRRRS